MGTRIPDWPISPPADGTQIAVVPGLVGMLDGGVPWPRTGVELEHEWMRLQRHARLLPAPGQPVTPFAMGEDALRGMLATAEWAMSYTQRTPITGDESLVTGARLKRETHRARLVMEARAPGWPYALGVLRWLQWLSSDDLPVYLVW